MTIALDPGAFSREETQRMANRARFRFLRLDVWQHGRLLYRQVARLVRRFPREEQYDLASQMRRSARSVCANVAEGAGRNSDRDFAQFIEVAYGSAMEVASDAFPALDAGYITETELDQLLDEVEVVAAKSSGLYRQLERSGAPRSALRAPQPRKS